MEAAKRKTHLLLGFPQFLPHVCFPTIFSGEFCVDEPSTLQVVTWGEGPGGDSVEVASQLQEFLPENEKHLDPSINPWER